MKILILISGLAVITSGALAESVCGKVKSISTSGGRLAVSIVSPKYKEVGLDVWISKNQGAFGTATLAEEAATQRVLSLAQTALISGLPFCAFSEKAVTPGSGGQPAYLRVKEADSVSVGN